MSYTRRYPLGVPVGQVISSGDFEYWDTSISTAVDGGGGTYSGPIILTGATIGGSSTVNTTGTVTAGAGSFTSVYVSGDINVDGGLFANSPSSIDDALDVSGILTVGDAIIVSGGTERIEADRIIVNRVLCESPGTQAIDCSTGAVLALNFIADDTWIVTLSDSSDPTTCAILTTTCTLVDTSAFTHLQVKPGSKISITFKADAAQTGGIGLTPGIFPASFRNLLPSDILGPRTGQGTGTDGEKDWIRLDLENIGTAATPDYEVRVTMGSKL